MDGWVGCQIGRGLRALPLTLHTCAQVRNKDVESLLHEKLEGNAEWDLYLRSPCLSLAATQCLCRRALCACGFLTYSGPSSQAPEELEGVRGAIS